MIVLSFAMVLGLVVGSYQGCSEALAREAATATATAKEVAADGWGCGARASQALADLHAQRAPPLG
jgi:hypothetical protein